MNPNHIRHYCINSAKVVELQTHMRKCRSTISDAYAMSFTYAVHLPVQSDDIITVMEHVCDNAVWESQ